MKANTLAIFLLCGTLLLAACAPQAAEDGDLPTLVVLPSLEPTLEATAVPPTAVPTETPLPTTTPEATPLPEPTAEAALMAAVNPGDGNMLPGCDTWINWDASRLELRDQIYAQAPASDPATTALLQLQQLRAEVALLDYDECLIEARSAYLSALDSAAAALSAPDRTTADNHEISAGLAMTQFDNALLALENS